jgi:hypothetical protein
MSQTNSTPLLSGIVNATLCVVSAINKSILNRIIEQIPIDQFKSETPEAKLKNIFGEGNFTCLLVLIGTLVEYGTRLKLVVE